MSDRRIAGETLRVVALAGGVGGARLAHGLAHVLAPEALTVIVNTGDDFEWLGLAICPDIDTVLYTLAGLEHSQHGWGLAGDTLRTLEALGALGGPTWFQVGDRDLATHLRRTELLRRGCSLSEVTRSLADAAGVRVAILPMSDDPIRTRVLTDEGDLAFQEYFVRRACEPRVRSFRYEGLKSARPASGVREALQQAQLVVFCPSNPFVSIDPILSLPGLREHVASLPAVAVSPIIGGRAVKGPAAKMMRELGLEPGALAVARHYAGLLRGIVIDTADAGEASAIEALGMRALVAPTLMRDGADRAALARAVLDFGRELLER